MKFGGSVLSTAEDFQRLVEIVGPRHRKGEEILLVNSALHGVTDELIQAAEQAVTHTKHVSGFVNRLRRRHENALRLVSSPRIAGRCRAVLAGRLDRLEKALNAINSLQNLAPRTQDLVYTFGERLSAPIMEAYLLDAGVQAKALDADEAGLVTDSSYGKANPRMDLIKRNFKKIGTALKDTIAIITGYFGVDENSNVVCFGRGGSDFSAGIMANAVGANALELWKDIGCFYSADSRTVKGAQRLERLSYDEAEELGYFGAKIIHPKTIPPLKEKNIKALVKNVFKPRECGTLITARPRKTGKTVKAIASKKNIGLITVRSASMVDVPGYLGRLFGLLSEHGIAVDMVSTSEASVSFTIDRKDLLLARKALAGLERESERMRFESDVALIGVIGEALRSTPGIVGKAANCLGKAGINLEAISLGASEIDVLLVVKERHRVQAVQVLHRALVEGKT